MIELRDLIINESRSWIGTKFHHQGRIKKSTSHDGGCDCIGLILGIARNLSLKSKLDDYLINYDKTDYPKLSKNELSNFTHKHFYHIQQSQIDIGDLILFKIGRYLQHIAMIYKIENKHVYIIHSHMSTDSVTAHIINDYWISKIYRYYRFSELHNILKSPSLLF